jgi:hypothetical protein
MRKRKFEKLVQECLTDDRYTEDGVRHAASGLGASKNRIDEVLRQHRERPWLLARLMTKLGEAISAFKFKIDAENYLIALGLIALTWAAIGLATLITISIVRSAKSDGKSDYCYVQPDGSGNWALEAHVPWRNDRRLAVESTAVAAAASASKLGCTSLR